MLIGEKIKKLRKTEMLTQQEFAYRLKINSSYISMLEKGKNIPSEQLILNICREFGVSEEWLKGGTGDMYDRSLRLTPKGHRIIDAIVKEFENPDRFFSMSDHARILGINPDDPEQRLDLPKDYAGAIYIVNRVFMEGDKTKIDGLMGMLKILKPPKTAGEIVAAIKKKKDCA